MEFSTATHRPLQANHFSLTRQHHDLFQRDLIGGRVTKKGNKINTKVQRKMGEFQDSLLQSHLYRGKRRGSNDSTEDRRIPLANKRLLTECNNLAQVDSKKGVRNVNQSNANKLSYGKFTKFSIEEICSSNRYTSDSSISLIDNNATNPKPTCELKTVSFSGNREVASNDLNETIISASTGKERRKKQVMKESSRFPSTLDKLNNAGSDSCADLKDFDILSNCQENDSGDSAISNETSIKEHSFSEHERNLFENGCKGPVKRKRRVDQEERRRIANERERSRVHTLAAAFDALREAIPSFSPSQKLSKLTILKVAINYISALDSLNSGMPTILSKDHFSDSVDACTHALKAEYGRAKRISWHDKK